LILVDRDFSSQKDDVAGAVLQAAARCQQIHLATTKTLLSPASSRRIKDMEVGEDHIDMITVRLASYGRCREFLRPAALEFKSV